MEKGKGGELRRCWEEIGREKARTREALKGWKDERKEFMEERGGIRKRGWELGEIENLRDISQLKGEELWKSEKRI